MQETVAIKVLSDPDTQQIKPVFLEVFTDAPWNDDWSDERQLDLYFKDIMDNGNSLSMGLYNGDVLLGCALGSLIHWYTGTEYYIREFFISRNAQGNGLGTRFIKLLEQYLVTIDVHKFLLSTERNAPAYGFYVKNGFIELTDSRFLYKSFE